MNTQYNNKSNKKGATYRVGQWKRLFLYYCLVLKKITIKYFNHAKSILLATPQTEGGSPSIQGPVKFGMLTLLCFFGFFTLWTLFIPLDAAAIAPGKVTVDSNRKSIQHLEGGIIKSIFIKEGDTVKTNQPLILLDDTQAVTSFRLLKSRANELRARIARLIAERDNLPQIIFDQTLTEQDITENLKRVMQGETAVFNANKTALQSQLKILDQRNEQLKREIDALTAQVQANSTQLSLIEEEIEAVAYLEERKLIPKPRLLALRREAARLKGERGQDQGLISRAQQRMLETQQQKVTLQETTHQRIVQELHDTQSLAKQVIEQEKAASDIYNRTVIRSPIGGSIVGLQTHTLGGVIKPGQVLMQIVPDNDRLVVDAQVSPSDIDMVSAGLLAKVRFSAFKQRSSPSLKGKVIRVSADSFEDDTNHQPYYLARIEISSQELKRLGGQDLHPGMSAEVMIITETRTPFSYFISPLRDSFSRAFKES